MMRSVEGVAALISGVETGSLPSGTKALATMVVVECILLLAYASPQNSTFCVCFAAEFFGVARPLGFE